jgi:hypothetical protein
LEGDITYSAKCGSLSAAWLRGSWNIYFLEIRKKNEEKIHVIRIDSKQ